MNPPSPLLLLFLLLLPSSLSLSLSTPSPRRTFLSSASLLLPLSTLPSPSFAASDSTTTFEDTAYGFTVEYPDSWQSSPVSLADRRSLSLFVDPDQTNTNFFVAYTPVRDDFTSLSSFGTLESVATTILPKGDLANTHVESTLISSKSTSGPAYVYDYTVTLPDSPTRHLVTLFTLLPPAANNGVAAGSTLVTVTCQCLESDYGKEGGRMAKVVDSFVKAKKKK